MSFFRMSRSCLVISSSRFKRRSSSSPAAGFPLPTKAFSPAWLNSSKEQSSARRCRGGAHHLGGDGDELREGCCWILRVLIYLIVVLRCSFLAQDMMI